MVLALFVVSGGGVGMYLRTTQRRNTDGSVIRYLQVAHNRRVDGVTQAEVLLNLGREDRLDADGLKRLVGSINRYLGEADGGDDVVEVAGDALTVIESRPAGTAWLLDGLWRQLGVDTALAKVLGARRFTVDVERVLFAMVANRAIAPMSKLATAEWANHDVALPGVDVMDEDQAYRAMDLLVAADAQAEVQEAVFFAVADLLNLEVDLLFFDTTSTYFERDTEEQGDDAFRRYGHSKDHRPDLPQIVIGLAVTREGIPVRVWCWPGNTNDQTVLPEVKDGLRGWRLGRVVTVVDRGFSSDANLDYLRRAGGHWIAGERMRDGSPDALEALARAGRYPLRDHKTLGRYLRQNASGRLQIDRAKIRAEERLDGKYLLSTSDPDLSAEDVVLGYKNLLEAERGFRDLKSTLELRPVFHRLEGRIRAHVLLCWLALLLTRVAERRANMTWRRIAIELGRVHAVTLQGTAGTVIQTTPLSDAASGILGACQVDPPPRITHLHPA